MKVATWNVNSLNVRLSHVLDWVSENQPDILALQETKLTDEKFPVGAINEAGYQVVYAGQKTYNGVAVLSRTTGSDVVYDVPGLQDPARRILCATYANLRFLNLYVVNGQAVGTDKYSHKLHWLEQVTQFVRGELTRHEHFIVVGDFNIAPDDRDVHDPEAWREKILCSTPERNALAALCELGLADTFRLFDQPEQAFSWWDYRAAAIRRNLGLRIDLILASQSMAARCRGCEIDKTPRKWERPSDHTPVVAVFDLES